MKSERPLAVVFFRTDAGNEPVRGWLKGLARAECQAIGKKTRRTPKEDLNLAKKRQALYLQNHEKTHPSRK